MSDSNSSGSDSPNPRHLGSTQSDSASSRPSQGTQSASDQFTDQPEMHRERLRPASKKPQGSLSDSGNRVDSRGGDAGGSARRGVQQVDSEEPASVKLARRWGFKAYLFPVLVLVTLVIIGDAALGNPLSSLTSKEKDSSGSQSASGNQTPGPVPSAAKTSADLDKSLPAGGAFTEKGEGTYNQVGKAGQKIGKGSTKTYTYVVEVEKGLKTSDYGGDDAVSAMIDATLSDPRSWIHDQQFAFEHIDPSKTGQTPDLKIQLTSPDTAHTVCGESINIETSCFTPIGNRVVLNESRWVRGAGAFDGDLGSYRQYMINHEVGHGIGYAQHEPCGTNGALAPIMMQQTLSLNNSAMHNLDAESSTVYPDDHKVCRYNAWPYPQG